MRVSLKDADKNKIEYLYHEDFPFNSGYFSDIDELEEHCNDIDAEMPPFVYGTDKIRLSIDAEHTVVGYCAELHEDAFDSIPQKEIEELQEFLDKWCAKQTGTDSYLVDWDYIVLI